MARATPSFFLLLLLVALAALAASALAAPSFVRVSGKQLTLDGAPFYFTGGNAYWLSSPTASHSQVDALFGAMSALGMRVARTWAFSEASPSGGNDLSKLDYVVASASRHNLRLILALGNTWKAYGGPEKWLDDASGKTIADFYADEGARERYRAHIARVTTRVNTLTGVSYRDDATILAFDVINEPRCPSCDSAQQSARDAWLDEMAAAVRSNVPNQLVLMGSEGFYGSGSANARNNPGAGSACEGDSFEGDSAKASAATAHVYWRQVEGTPDRSWARPGYDEYIPYLGARLDLHERVAASLSRPLVIEEFGLTTRFFDEQQVRAAVAVVLDRLVRSKQRGGALAGALIWGLIAPGTSGSNEAGYDIALDGGASASDVGLGGASGVFSGGGGGGGGGGGSGGGGSSSPSSSANATSTGGGRRRRRHHRRLQQAVDVVEDALDAFRRGPQREACANARASGWSFPYDFARATGLSGEAVKAAVGGASVSSLFKEAASKL